jgi:hypothetical protein
MRGAVRGVTPLQSIRMRERACNFSAHFTSGGAPAPHCTNDCPIKCNTVTQPVENLNLKLRIIRSVKFHACGPIQRA